MAASFFSKIEIRNYGCIENLTLEPSALHAFIGPNDSGKSTILRGIRTACELAAGNFSDRLTPFDTMLEDGRRTQFELEFRGGRYEVKQEDSAAFYERLHPIDSQQSLRNLSGLGPIAKIGGSSSRRNALEEIAARFTRATLLRLDPDALRGSSALIPDTKGISFLDDRGTGLPAVLDAIMNRDVSEFIEIREAVKQHFENVTNIGLMNVGGHKELSVTLKNGTRLPAKAVSEGLLYFLAFSVLKHISTSRIFLIEEPENGLHPARIGEVMKILREISKDNQVFIATHSPLVINELEADEISLITRDPITGSRATRLDRTKNYENRSKVYLNGELWIAYGDGNKESELTGPSGPEKSEDPTP
jgi:predicted ATPase